jgi:large subunit ribosomal protein L22
MSNYKYAFKDYNKESMARAVILASSVSTKHCIEICNHIKGRKISAAKTILNDAIELKKAIPFKRFNHNVGHKRKIGPGRYPQKACQEVLTVINSCEANAQGKGLNTSELIITHICANMASRPWRYGRARRRKTKKTHVEVVLVEEVKTTKKKQVKKETPKTEEKQVVKETKPEVKEEAKVEEKKTEEKPMVKETKPEVKKEVVEDKPKKEEIKVEDKPIVKEAKPEEKKEVAKEEPKTNDQKESKNTEVKSENKEKLQSEKKEE